MTDLIDRTTAPAGIAYVQWGPVIAGAIAAAALASVLHAFAGAIGLAVGSTAPTWRDASMALWLLSGLYLMLVALAAYGLGGYLAGRLRTAWAPAGSDEIEFRGGVHGLLVWSLATLLTALLLLLAASAATRLAAPSAGAAGPSASVAGENIIALDIDRLLRGERRAGDADVVQTRAEAARILLTSSGHSGVVAEDRSYLIRLVAARTGLAPADAERRVDTAIASARENIARARRATVILAFMAGAAALIGAAAAWFAATLGGKHRDETAPSLRWTVLGPRVLVRR
jgi:hypothetical protein